MLPQVRPALFGMALLAGIIHGFTREIGRDAVAMQAVAAAAVHLAFHQRMCECFPRLAALPLMAVVTDLLLRRRLQYRITRRVTVVTVGASNVVFAVRPTMPGKTLFALVAVQAHAILLGDRRRRICGEDNNGRALLTAPYSASVCAAGSVAGLALQLSMPKRTARVGRHRMLAAEYSEHSRIGLVTGEAGIGAFSAVFGLGFVGRLRRNDDGQTQKQQHCDIARAIGYHAGEYPGLARQAHDEKGHRTSTSRMPLSH